jgi:hypothetical protein
LIIFPVWNRANINFVSIKFALKQSSTSPFLAEYCDSVPVFHSNIRSRFAQCFDDWCWGIDLPDICFAVVHPVN